MKIKPFFKDLLLTLVTEVAVLFSFFLIYRFIAVHFGSQGVGEYSLVRRVVGLLQPVLLLGLGVGLARYIALFYHQRYGYMRIACIVVIGFTALSLVVINLFPVFISTIFFGNANYSSLLFPLSVFLMGMMLHSLVYSYYRGTLGVSAFNALEILNLAVAPLILLFVLNGAGLAGYILWVGVAMVFVSLVFSVGFIKKLGKEDNPQTRAAGGEMLRYGISRVLGDFMFNGFFSATVIVAVHFVTMKEVGYLSAGQSMLNILAAATAPMSLVLLPKISRFMSEKRDREIKENIEILLGAIFYVSAFISFQLAFFADIFIYYWLGSDFLDAANILRVMGASAGFYFIYLILRSVIDAAEFKPVNTFNIGISFAAFLAVLFFCFKYFVNAKPLFILAASFSFGVALLGVLTYLSVQKIYRRGFVKDFPHIFGAIIINFFLVVLAMQFKNWITSIYSLVFLETIIGIIYFAVIWFLRIGWMRKLPAQIFSKVR